MGLVDRNTTHIFLRPSASTNHVSACQHRNFTRRDAVSREEVERNERQNVYNGVQDELDFGRARQHPFPPTRNVA